MIVIGGYIYIISYYKTHDERGALLVANGFGVDVLEQLLRFNCKRANEKNVAPLLDLIN